KFFGGNQNGNKAAPQQSKLTFGSKAGVKAKVEKDAGEGEASAGAANGNGVHGHVKDENVKDEDVKMEDSTPVKVKESGPVKEEDGKGDEVLVKEEPASTASAKKRTASDAAGEDDQE
ncbi:hypothetical protein LTR53_018771, partial [Teratosphaeriaceae sp. CCFEE 6253]